MSVVKEREGLNKIPPYQPAKSIESVKQDNQIDSIIKLAGNENRIGCSFKVMEMIKEEEGQFSFYPDMNCTLLREKLSLIHMVKDTNLIFGNGSFELIALLAHAFLENEEESIIPQPSFGWYKNVTLQMNAKPIFVPLKDYTIDTDAILDAITIKTKIIWICNPNNPTGTVIEAKRLIDFIQQVPEHILLVLDEAYIDFVEETYFDTVDFVRHYKNVILLRTFSKLYGLASFRIGYGIADGDIIEKLNKVRSPINVSLTAQKAALASLEDKRFVHVVLENNQKSLKLYYQELKQLGLNYIRSNANFILIQINKEGMEVEDFFLKRGIMIRNATEFGLNGWIRVSIGTFEENKKVISVLNELAL